MLGDVKVPGTVTTTLTKVPLTDLIRESGGVADSGWYNLRVIRQGEINDVTRFRGDKIPSGRLNAGDIVLLSAEESMTGTPGRTSFAVVSPNGRIAIRSISSRATVKDIAGALKFPLTKSVSVVPKSGKPVLADVSSHVIQGGDVVVFPGVMGAANESEQTLPDALKPKSTPTPGLTVDTGIEEDGNPFAAAAKEAQAITEKAQTFGDVTANSARTAAQTAANPFEEIGNTAAESADKIQSFVNDVATGVPAKIQTPSVDVQVPQPDSNSDSTVPAMKIGSSKAEPLLNAAQNPQTATGTATTANPFEQIQANVRSVSQSVPQELEQSASASANGVKDTLQNSVEQATDWTKNAAQNAVQNVTNSVKGTAHNAADAAGAAVQNTIDSATSAVPDAVQKTTESIREKAGAAVESATEAASTVMPELTTGNSRSSVPNLGLQTPHQPALETVPKYDGQVQMASGTADEDSVRNAELVQVEESSGMELKPAGSSEEFTVSGDYWEQQTTSDKSSQVSGPVTSPDEASRQQLGKFLLVLFGLATLTAIVVFISRRNERDDFRSFATETASARETENVQKQGFGATASQFTRSTIDKSKQAAGAIVAGPSVSGRRPGAPVRLNEKSGRQKAGQPVKASSTTSSVAAIPPEKNPVPAPQPAPVVDEPVVSKQPVVAEDTTHVEPTDNSLQKQVVVNAQEQVQQTEIVAEPTVTETEPKPQVSERAARIESLIGNRVSVDVNQPKAAGSITLSSNPGGPRALRIDPAQTLQGPHFAMAATNEHGTEDSGEAESSVTVQVGGATARIDSAQPAPVKKPRMQTDSAGVIDRALSSIQRTYE